MQSGKRELGFGFYTDRRQLREAESGRALTGESEHRRLPDTGLSPDDDRAAPFGKAIEERVQARGLGLASNQRVSHVLRDDGATG